jgi:hypothetical protein
MESLCWSLYRRLVSCDSPDAGIINHELPGFVATVDEDIKAASGSLVYSLHNSVLPEGVIFSTAREIVSSIVSKNYCKPIHNTKCNLTLLLFKLHYTI